MGQTMQKNLSGTVFSRLGARLSLMAGLAVATSPMVAAPALAAKKAAPATKRVSAMGEAPVVDGDTARAIENAKRQARRNAIEQGAGVAVASRSIVRNFTLVADEIVSAASGVLLDEEWGKPEVAGGVAKVSLTATVAREAMEDAVCTAIKANHDPRIALVFVERHGSVDTPYSAQGAGRGVVEAMMARGLMDNCFTIVETGIEVSKVAANGDIPQKYIDQIAQTANAQYILVGKGEVVTKSNSLFNSRMRSYGVSISTRLFDVSTKTYVSVTTAEGTAPAMSASSAVNQPSIRERVLQKTLGDLFVEVGKKWTDAAVNGAMVAVEVRNVAKYADAKAMEKAVKAAFQQSELTAFQRRSVKNKRAQFDLVVAGGADEFAARMEGKRVGRHTIEVLEVTNTKVVVTLK